MFENIPALNKDTVLTIMSGAGISAESGIATFRGEDGIWSDQNIMKIATPTGFGSDPKRGWEFYNQRRMNMGGVEPHDAHLVLAELEKDGYDICVITQNIDRLHQKAGSENVIELHGSLWEVKCSNKSCSSKPYENRDIPIKEFPLVCNICGEYLRPNVVFFEEQLDIKNVINADERTKKTDIFLVIGTSGVVYPAAGYVHIAKNSGAYVCELNLAETPLSSTCDLTIAGKCGETLPILLEKMKQLGKQC